MYKDYSLKQNIVQKRGRLKPDFELLPQDQVPPSIVSQPIRNFIQYTFLDKNNNPLSVQTTNTNIVRVVKNTTIGFSVIVEDPSNVLDIYNTDNLKFVWKLNDSEIYALSSLNKGNGTSQVYLDGIDTTPAINGEYCVEISNKYGTTISDKFTIQVIDPVTDPLLNKNLIKNSTGNKGVEDWDLSDDIIVRQLEQDKAFTRNFASIYSIQVPVERKSRNDATIVGFGSKLEGETPFTFSKANSWINFDDMWNNVKFNGVRNKADDWQYLNIPPTIVNNEQHWRGYNQFFPSPYIIDSHNKNDQKDKSSLINDFGTLPTYFTRDRLKFVKKGGNPKSEMSQTIDVSSIADLIDGNVTGINKLIAHFFTYIGVGISKYNYTLFDSSNTPITTLDTYILNKTNWCKFIANQPFEKYTIPSTVKRIDLQPITNDVIDIQIDCLTDGGNIVKSEVVQGPREKDIFSIKEKFLLSTYVNKLFNYVTNFAGDIDVYIFGKKYFAITKNPTLNQNTTWIKSYYPKYVGPQDDWSWDKWEKGDYNLRGFDKGATAMFGFNKDIQIPAKTRSIKVTALFTHNSRAINDLDSLATTQWSDDIIYAEYLANGGIYDYNYPRTALTQTKLVLTTNTPEINNSYSTYFLPTQNVWKFRKSQLDQNIHDETKAEVIYYSTDGTPEPAKVFIQTVENIPTNINTNTVTTIVGVPDTQPPSSNLAQKDLNPQPIIPVQQPTTTESNTTSVPNVVTVDTVNTLTTPEEVIPTDQSSKFTLQ